jgi:hypothetical protein
MKIKKIKLFEALNLEAEITGVSNTQTGERLVEGLVSQKIPIVTKYWLNTLLESLEKEKTKLTNLREELIKKYGEEDNNGAIGISQSIKTDKLDEQGNPVYVVNPNYIEFIKEYNPILEENIDINLPSISLDELSKIETSDNYPLIFKYLVQPPVEEVKAEEVI